jgi:hypothetical protein
MILILLSALVGAGVAFFVLWPYGTVVACIAAPFGGGMFAALAAFWLGRRSRIESSRRTPSAPGDEPTESHASEAKVNSRTE